MRSKRYPALTALACLAALLLLPGVASAAHNDFIEDARAGDADLERLEPTTGDDNLGYSTEPGEPLGCGPVAMDSTAWYRFRVPNTAPVTLTTRGSDFDTVLAVYGPDGPGGATRVGCNDDTRGQTSELGFSAQGGAWYLVQVGGCTGNAACGDSEGSIELELIAPPPNDLRSRAEALTFGRTLSRDNVGATIAGEPLDCGPIPYDSTAWFRFTVPEIGDATITASSTSMDPVVAVFAGSSNTALACVDDAPGESLSSEVSVRVAPGVYYVQVGAHMAGPAGGPFDVRVTYQRDLDLDNDGALRNVDCNDRNPAIKPGLPERVNNDVDENCDGVKAFDRDGDGSLAPPAGGDCRDDDPRIRPGARDVPGNALDEDCVPPRAQYSRVSATFRVRYRFYEASRGEPSRLEFVQLGVRDLQRGSTVTLQCRGSRACPARRIVRKVRRERTVSFLVRYRKDLPVKTSLRLSVTRPESIGLVRALRVGARSVDDRTLCMWPNQRRLRRCGGGSASAGL